MRNTWVSRCIELQSTAVKPTAVTASMRSPAVRWHHQKSRQCVTHSTAESRSSRRIFFSATRLATPFTRRPTIVDIWSLLQDTKLSQYAAGTQQVSLFVQVQI